MKTHLFLLLSLLWGQCLPVIPPPPSCPPACALPDTRPGYYEVPAGQTRCIPGNTIFTTNWPLHVQDGATLIVCGRLNIIGNLYPAPNSTIYIAPGAQLSVSQELALNATGAMVYNYGTVSVGSSLYVNGGTSFYNLGSGANLQVGMNIGVGGILGIYGGRVSLGNGSGALWVNWDGRVCMRDGGCLSIQGNFGNNQPGGIEVVGSNPVAVNFVGGNAWLNQPLTNSSNLHVCVAPGSTVWGSWGSAQVYNNCTQGCGVLPYVRLSVSGRMAETDQVYLEWKIEGVSTIPAKYRVYLKEKASYTLVAETERLWAYVRVAGAHPWLFQVEALDASGQLLATGHALVGPESCKEVRVYPNPFVRRLHYTYCGTEHTEAYLYDVQGRLIQRLKVEPGEGTWDIAEDLPQGLYFLQVGETGTRLLLSKQ